MNRNIKDIEIALRDGLIAELQSAIEDSQFTLRKARNHIEMMDQTIDKWREIAHEYRALAYELLEDLDGK